MGPLPSTSIQNRAGGPKNFIEHEAECKHQLPGFGARPEDKFCIRCGREANLGHRKGWLHCTGPCFTCNSISSHIGKACPQLVKRVDRWWWRFRGVEGNIPGHPNTPPDLPAVRNRARSSTKPNAVGRADKFTVVNPLTGVFSASYGQALDQNALNIPLSANGHSIAQNPLAAVLSASYGSGTSTHQSGWKNPPSAHDHALAKMTLDLARDVRQTASQMRERQSYWASGGSGPTGNHAVDIMSDMLKASAKLDEISCNIVLRVAAHMVDSSDQVDPQQTIAFDLNPPPQAITPVTTLEKPLRHTLLNIGSNGSSNGMPSGLGNSGQGSHSAASSGKEQNGISSGPHASASVTDPRLKGRNGAGKVEAQHNQASGGLPSGQSSALNTLLAGVRDVQQEAAAFLEAHRLDGTGEHQAPIPDEGIVQSVEIEMSLSPKLSSSEGTTSIDSTTGTFIPDQHESSASSTVLEDHRDSDTILANTSMTRAEFTEAVEDLIRDVTGGK